MHTPTTTATKSLILASTSPYRRELLGRLGMPFDTCKPGVDEARLPHEPAEAMVRRLAREKARAVARLHPSSWIIGSDQCAVLDQQVLGKPGNHERAFEQLKAASGRTVVFHTGLCLMRLDAGFERTLEVPFTVRFRSLRDEEIHRYLEREKPYDCAGSFKSEGLGIALFDAMHGTDPTALIGLPLIALCGLLREAGIDPLA
ncbi:MAG: septum formation inhibitor Maf [Halothiobacillaceae bacterium]|nr:MAG: septum formation inhibitor Maf [Halothiobacillaceae bacterium]